MLWGSLSGGLRVRDMVSIRFEVLCIFLTKNKEGIKIVFGLGLDVQDKLREEIIVDRKL